MIDVSVIVPVYKVEAYIRPFLDSLLAQTHKNFEAILVDDGSPDASGAICDEYAARDARLRVIHKQNEGTGRARNTGMDAAQGDYIYFCDPDDLLDAHLLEDNLRIARREDADIVAFGYTEMKEGEKKVILPALSGVYTYEAFWDHFPQAHALIATLWVRLYRRAYLQKHNLRAKPLTNGQDAYFHYESYAAPFERIAFNPKAYYTYRIRSNSAQRSGKPEYWENEYRCACRLEESLHAVPQVKGRYQDICDEVHLRFCRMEFKRLAQNVALTPAKKREKAIDYACRPPVRAAIGRASLKGNIKTSYKLINLLLRLHLYDLVLMIYRVHSGEES